MLGGWELGVGSCRAQRHERLAFIVVEAGPGCGYCRRWLPAGQRARPYAALARRGPASLRRDRRVRPAAGDGLLARAHPSRHVLLPSPRDRRHHQRKLRRRVDRPHHRAIWLRNCAEARQPAAASRRCINSCATCEREDPRASRSMARVAPRELRSLGPCGSPRTRATRCCRFTWRRRPTGACAAGTGRRSRSRSAPSHSWLANRSRWRRDRRTTRSKSCVPTSSADLSHSNSGLTRYS